MIYFVRSGDYIKIGYSLDPVSRMRDLAVCNPNPLEMIGVMPGGLQKERELHGRFAHLAHRGEWFMASADLLSWISESTTMPAKSSPVCRRVQEFELRRLAVACECDPRTIRKVIAGGVTAKRVHDRVLDALATAGYMKELNR